MAQDLELKCKYFAKGNSDEEDKAIAELHAK